MSRHASAKDVLGIALTPASITAAAAAVPTVWSSQIELNGGANGSRESLAAALAEAARASGLGSPTIVVALMPPLSETRTIALPPLRQDDRDRFLARNAGRYFLSARGAQIVGTQSGAPYAKGAPATPVLATTTTQQLMQSLQAAAAAAGCEVRSVVPAESAWAAAAVALWPLLARGTAHVLVTSDDRSDMLTLVNGSLDAVRRFRGPADAEQIGAIAAGRDNGKDSRSAARIAIIGPADASRALSDALMSVGVHVLAPEPRWRELCERPEALAARFAASAVGLEFRSDESRVQQQGEIRRLTWWTLGIAAALLLIATGVHFAGVKRELASVQAERSAIRSQVDASLVGRSSVDATYRQVAGLAGAARSAPRWSSVLANLAAHLPIDASLTSVRARGDSIFIDGVAEQAAPVFDEIGRMPGVISLRATAPVRRDAIEGEIPLEHFSIGAQLGPVKR
ncbi:MAG: hypothetical protein O2973_07590 [Gemmatimonadetes bacterium]|nr:hypothetical protein [Gemmatimonadota bacterium]